MEQGHRLQTRQQPIHSRHPTPPGHGGDCRTVAGIFSLEDLHRSVLLVCLTDYRRTYGNNINSKRRPQARGKFLGYFDVLTQKPTLDGETELSAMQLVASRLLDNPLSATNTVEQPIHNEDLAAKEAAEVLRTPQRTPRKDSNSRAGITFDDQNLDLHTLYIECVSVRQTLRHHYGAAAKLAGNRPSYETLDSMTKEE